MTNEEAIRLLRMGRLAYSEVEAEAFCEAYEMAIKALEKEPCEDAISRQAAIDLADELKDDLPDDDRLSDMVMSHNIWYTIKGFNRNYSHDANVENGVDLPDVGRDVLVIYPRIKGVYAKKSTEEGMTGTEYYDGTMWAYYDKPVTDIDGGNKE